MRVRTAKVACQAVVIAAGLAAAAFGQNQVTFDYSNPNGASLAGEYTNPYQATVTPLNFTGYSGAIAAYCDDLAATVIAPESWTADATDLAGVNSSSPVLNQNGTTVFNSLADSTTTTLTETEAYIAVAYLAMQSMTVGPVALDPSNPGTPEQEVLSWALWDIFDPTILGTSCINDSTTGGCLDNGDPNYSSDALAAQSYVNKAVAVALGYANDPNAGADFESSIGADVQIYTPAPNTGAGDGCTIYGAAPCGSPQEFVAIEPINSNGQPLPTPEASVWATLGIDLVGVGMIGLVFRRRQLRNRL